MLAPIEGFVFPLEGALLFFVGAFESFLGLLAVLSLLDLDGLFDLESVFEEILVGLELASLLPVSFFTTSFLPLSFFAADLSVGCFAGPSFLLDLVSTGLAADDLLGAGAGAFFPAAVFAASAAVGFTSDFLESCPFASLFLPSPLETAASTF